MDGQTRSPIKGKEKEKEKKIKNTQITNMEVLFDIFENIEYTSW